MFAIYLHWKCQRYVLKHSRQVFFLQVQSTCWSLNFHSLEKWTFFNLSHLETPKMCTESHRTGLHLYAGQSDLRGPLPRFIPKINVLLSISLETPITSVLKLYKRGFIYTRQSIWGVTCLHLLEKWTFSHLSPWKPQKCVLKPSEEGSFFEDDQFERSHAYVYSQKWTCFPIYLLGNCINEYWNPQKRSHYLQDNWFEGSHAYIYSEKWTCFTIYFLGNCIICVLKSSEQGLNFSKMIDLRGHMPRFTLKNEHVMLSTSLETP